MKFFLPIIILGSLLLFGCSKNADDDYSNKSLQELWIDGYVALSSDSDYDRISVYYLFFEANNDEEFITGEKRYNGDLITEYLDLEDETYSLLKEDKIKLKTGEIVDAVAVEFAYSQESGSTTVKLPPGKYFICTIAFNSYQETKNKYTAQYFELTSRYNPHALTVVFPCDISRYGMIPWTSWNEKFAYEF